MPQYSEALDALADEEKFNYSVEDDEFFVGIPMYTASLNVQSYKQLGAIEDNFLVYYTSVNFMTINPNNWLEVYEGVDASYPVFFEVVSGDYKSRTFTLRYDPYQEECKCWDDQGRPHSGYSLLFEEIDWENNYYYLNYNKRFKFKWNTQDFLDNDIKSITVRYVPVYSPAITLPVNVQS